MDVCGLSKARPIVCNDSPAFHRRHTSARCATESSTYFPCVIDTTSEGRFISGGVASTYRMHLYKGRSQEKTHLLRLEFFLLLSPLDRASSVLTYRAMCSVARPCDSVGWVFSISGFHRFLATKPVSSETNKAERGQIWRP